MKKLLLILTLLAGALAGNSQHFSIIGKVVDSASKAPLAGASAFCPNTTYGSVCNAEGLFYLKLPQGGYDLVVSYTGYEKKIIRVSDDIKPTDTLQFELSKQQKSMEEVAVVASSEVADGWNKYGSFFLANFIGTSPNAERCVLKNPEVLHFYYTKKRNRLKVMSKEDLLVYNESLGYLIKYQLDSFTYDYNNNISQFIGFPLFIEVDTTAEVRRQYVKNRARTYLGSRMHFMRSLYNGQVNEEGFIVEKLPENARSTDSKLITDLYNPEEYISDSGEVIIGWEGRYKISYKSVLPDKKFLEEFKLPANSRYQVTILTVNDNFVIERNGYFYEQADLINNGYWAWKKLSELLPYDYVYQ